MVKKTPANRPIMDREERHKIMRRIERDIKRQGQSVVGIMDDGKSFYYTVGRTGRGLPELILPIGLTPEDGVSMLNQLDGLMPERIASGTLVDLGGQFPVMIIDATDPRATTEFTHVANAYYGRGKYTLQQVVLCDREGGFPPDCKEPWNTQPLFGDPKIRAN